MLERPGTGSTPARASSCGFVWDPTPGVHGADDRLGLGRDLMGAGAWTMRPVGQRRQTAPFVACDPRRRCHRLFLEEVLVIPREPLGEFRLVFDLDQVHGSLLTSAKVRVCEVGKGSAALIQIDEGLVYRRISAHVA